GFLKSQSLPTSRLDALAVRARLNSPSMANLLYQCLMFQQMKKGGVKQALQQKLMSDIKNTLAIFNVRVIKLQKGTNLERNL
ncbi:MAG: hypothetical protein KAT90_08075, partial [Gammaproteobacteria bacterium]|nr:hypothetical protein [Gammaproteobacteria bacterium]